MKNQCVVKASAFRRAFLKTAGMSIALLALAPVNAFAAVGGTTVSPAGGVDNLWTAAIANARKRGDNLLPDVWRMTQQIGSYHQMSKARTAVTYIVTALLVPAAISVAWYLDPTLIDMYHKFDISSISFEAWRIGIAVFSAIATLWIDSRALKHRKADTISLAVGLVICLGLIFIVGFRSLISDIGLLIIVLTCSYIGALVIALAGKRSE